MTDMKNLWEIICWKWWVYSAAVSYIIPELTYDDSLHASAGNDQVSIDKKEKAR